MSIRLVAGLGNPGTEYEQTRHNAGFWFVDDLAKQMGVPAFSKATRFQAFAAKGKMAGQDAWLVKPQTFMNLSGRAVGALAHFYRIAPEEILVVHDELDIAPGAVRLKKGGSTGGHRGLNDIVAALGTQDFWRLRLGIGHPRNAGLKIAVIDYVLQPPGREDRQRIDEALQRALDVMPLLGEGQFDKAMMTLHTVR